MGDGNVYQLIDYEGREARLTDERRKHFLKHPEMTDQFERIVETVEAPQTVVATEVDETVHVDHRYDEETPVTLNHLRCPASQRKRIRTTNLLERAFLEVRRRTRATPRFLDERSCLKLIVAALMPVSDQWQRIRMSDWDRVQLDRLRQQLGIDEPAQAQAMSAWLMPLLLQQFLDLTALLLSKTDVHLQATVCSAQGLLARGLLDTPLRQFIIESSLDYSVMLCNESACFGPQTRRSIRQP